MYIVNFILPELNIKYIILSITEYFIIDQLIRFSTTTSYLLIYVNFLIIF